MRATSRDAVADSTRWADSERHALLRPEKSMGRPTDTVYVAALESGPTRARAPITGLPTRGICPYAVCAVATPSDAWARSTSGLCESALSRARASVQSSANALVEPANTAKSGSATATATASAYLGKGRGDMGDGCMQPRWGLGQVCGEGQTVSVPSQHGLKADIPASAQAGSQAGEPTGSGPRKSGT